MSWLRNTVNTSLSQLGGQLKDILAENTDDVVDTATELKTSKDKLKDLDRHNELLRNECKRLNEDLNEAIVKSEALEIQLENLSTNCRNQLAEKDSIIFDLRKEMTSVQQLLQQQEHHSTGDYEEIMPSSELNDYIRLQKEIKRLQEENKHLQDENHKLLKQATTPANTFKEIKIHDDDELVDYVEELVSPSSKSNLQNEIKSLKQQIEGFEKEIAGLRLRLKADSDKHQEEVATMQASFKDKLQQTIEAHRREIEKLNKEKDDLASWKDGWNTLDDAADTIKSSITTVSSVRSEESDEKIQSLTNEIERLNRDTEKLEIEVEESGKIIDELNGEIKKMQESAREELRHKTEIMNELAKARDASSKSSDLLARCERLELDLNMEREKCRENEEKLNEFKAENERLLVDVEQKQEKVKELEGKLLSTAASQQVAENSNNSQGFDETIKSLKLNETKLKLHFESEVSTLRNEVESTREENLNLNKSLNEKEKEKTQYLTVLDEKNQECLNLQNEITALQESLSELKSKLEKAESSTVAVNEMDEKDSEINMLRQTQMQQDQAYNELNMAYNVLQQERTQLYFYLNQKSEESINYYNEIQRLNDTIVNLNQELLKIKQEYLSLENELNLEAKLVEDLNSETENLKSELQQKAAQQPEKSDVSIETEPLKQEASEVKTELNSEELQLKLKEINEKDSEIEQLKAQIDTISENSLKLNEKLSNSQHEVKRMTSERDQALMNLREKELEVQMLTEQANKQINELNQQLSSMTEYRQRDLTDLTDQANQQITKLNKELERLREHLVEMSDNYTKEAILAENREKELRSMLTQAEENIANQNTNIVSANKEIQKRNHELTHENEDLKEEKQRLVAQLKEVEKSYQNQIVVTKNVELVLERLQKDKDSQHNNEILKYQETIKQNAITIHNLQKDIANNQAQISELKEVVGAASRLNEQLEKKDETISYLQQQIQAKEDTILMLETKINEVQKVNENYIEKDIIKNLVIGYLKVNTNERKQVLKLIGSMLNFQPHDYEQIEQNSLSSKWLSSIFTGGQSAAASKNTSPSKDALNKSFTELLIQYVDIESKPKPRITLDTSAPKQQNTGLLLAGATTNKKTDNPLFYPASTSTPPPSASQIFNPNAFLNRPSTTGGISAAAATTTSDYATSGSGNLSNRFSTPSPFMASQMQPPQATPQPPNLSSNNNSFLEDALN